MTVVFNKSKAVGTVNAPPSKSIAHRDLICAALSQNSTVNGISYSEDILATINCLEALGAKAIKTDNGVALGGLFLNPLKENILDCKESGSTLRFLLPLCLMGQGEITLKGSKRLFERPLDVYSDICKKNGLYFKKYDSHVTVCGKLCAGEYAVPGDVSSQFVSGLLFVLPLLENESLITIFNDFESAPYVALTVETLRNFGITVNRISEKCYQIPGNQRYLSYSCVVEGDYSNSAFLEAFNLFGGKVEVKGLSSKSLQGDRIYRNMFEKIKNGEKSFDLSDCPDLAPVLFAVSACFEGAHFTGTNRLRIKESDRALAMKQELEKFGISVNIGDNFVDISGSGLCKPVKLLDSHNDHRIAMALSLLCSLTGGTVCNAQAVNKSFPDFFEKLRILGVEFKQYET